MLEFLDGHPRRAARSTDATLFFDAGEIHTPTVNDVVRLIAQLGGILARKGDGEPGAKTIWRGLDKVQTAAQTLRALRENRTDDLCIKLWIRLVIQSTMRKKRFFGSSDGGAKNDRGLANSGRPSASRTQESGQQGHRRQQVR